MKAFLCGVKTGAIVTNAETKKPSFNKNRSRQLKARL
jgi:hypothetical protein